MTIKSMHKKNNLCLLKVNSKQIKKPMKENGL